MSPAPDLDQLSQLVLAMLLANASLHPALPSCAILHGSHSTRQLYFHWQIRAGEGPGPLQRKPSPSPMPRGLRSPHSGSCHSALCGRSWQGLMPGQPNASCLIRVIFLSPSSHPLSPTAPTQAGGLKTGEREGEEAGVQKQIQTSWPVCAVQGRKGVRR